MNKTIIVFGLAGVALYIVYSRKEKLQGEDPCFREGYVAGFFTPGPFTIMAIAGGIYVYG